MVNAQSEQELSGEDRFSNFEIRVIRPRFFSKRGRFELGLEGVVVTNQTFIYTYLMSGILTYHFSETFGLELGAAAGSSVDKDDKKVLDNDFSIKTQIMRTKTIFHGDVLWTPIYGKYQLASGRVVYFDTYLSAGAGSTGIEYQYDHCRTKDGQPDPNLPAERSVQYPTVNIGLGQRFFLNKNYSLKWDLRGHFYSASTRDGACKPESEEEQKAQQQNITLQFGASRFF